MLPKVLVNGKPPDPMNFITNVKKISFKVTDDLLDVRNGCMLCTFSSEFDLSLGLFYMVKLINSKTFGNMTRPRKPVVGHKPLSYNKLTNFPLNHLFDAYVPYGSNTYSTPADSCYNLFFKDFLIIITIYMFNHKQLDLV